MNFQLKFDSSESKQKITFGEKLIFLGSCFSDEISLMAKQHGFHVTANPFGTLFHPLAITKCLFDALHDNSELNIVKNEDVYFDYSCSGKVFGMSETELTEHVISLRKDLKNELKNAAYLYVTFGTAFAYHLNETQNLVGNCHKQPSHYFTKKLTIVQEIVTIWRQVVSELKCINPNIQICFTVSPVRHIKDGLKENNLSKSILFLAIDQLQSENEITYFPSFELVNDVLRDYRFFKEDLVHPNQQAIQFVWEEFMKTFLNSETIELAKKVKEIKIAMQHRMHYPESKMALKFQNQLKEQKRKLEIDNEEIYWE